MILIINNKNKEYPEDIKLQDLIAFQEAEINNPLGVMCAVNGILVNPPYDYVLSEHDNIRILPIPQGG